MKLISYYSSLPNTLKSKNILLKLQIAICRKFAAVNKTILPKLFPGFCNDTLPSVLSSLISENDDEKYDEIIEKSPIKYLPTLKNVIKKYENDKMLMILTYDFESSLDKNAHYLKNTTIKNLDEFNKADEFDTFIRKHFKKSKIEEKKDDYKEPIEEEKKIEMKELIKTDSLIRRWWNYIKWSIIIDEKFSINYKKEYQNIPHKLKMKIKIQCKK